MGSLMFPSFPLNKKDASVKHHVFLRLSVAPCQDAEGKLLQRRDVDHQCLSEKKKLQKIHIRRVSGDISPGTFILLVDFGTL